MIIFQLPKNRKIQGVISVLFMCILLLQAAGCLQTPSHGPSKKQEDREKILFSKLNKREKLTGLEIDRLVMILSREGQYNKALDILHRLSNSALYAKEKYIIHFGLSILYLTKARDEKKMRSQLLGNAVENLQKGFKSSPEKPLAYFKRAQVYAAVGCIKKAKEDIAGAINIAPYQDIIAFDNGLYASRERFLDLLNNRLESLEASEDNCPIKTAKGISIP